MSYSLGLDLGTTYSAVAEWRDGRVEVVPMASHQTTVPTVVFARDDQMLFGPAAARRGATEPTGLAREFKRRMGDPVPVLLSGSPYSADRLAGLYARWAVDTALAQLGGQPERVVVTHPANWTEFQLGLLRAALTEVRIPGVALLSEPEAAALQYASEERVAAGSLVLVYDLGGGTFDVALLRKGAAGFERVGEAAGIDRLGGIDFDDAVFHRVVGAIEEEAFAASRADEHFAAALAHLRRECVDAKESLSSDVTTEVQVQLPAVSTTVRLTRDELEGMIRPSIAHTVEKVKFTLESAQVEASEVTAVLLVGGSSRIPLVAEMLSSELGVDVRVDAHPKLVVARGAARYAGALEAGLVTDSGVTALAATARPDAGRRDPGGGAPGEPPNGTGGGKGRRTAAIVAGLVAAVVVIVVIALVAGLFGGDGSSDDDAEAGTTSTTSATTATTSATPSTGTSATPSTSTSTTEAPAPAFELPRSAAPLPDQTLVYTAVVGNVWSIARLDVAADASTSLNGNPAAQSKLPAISPDRRTIAFTRTEGGVSELLLLDADGNEARVTDQQMAPDARATWSPDGTQLAYAAEVGGSTDIVVLDLVTGTTRQLTDDGEEEGDPAWSPDGESVVFWKRRDGNVDIYRAAADGGGEPVRLTEDPGDDTDPAFSPDGSALAFARVGGDGRWHIWTMSPDGSGQRQVTSGDVDDQTPAFDPTGTIIVFESTRDGLKLLWQVEAASDGSVVEPVATFAQDSTNLHAAWGTPAP